MVSTSAPGNEGGQAADSAPGIPGTSHDALSWYAVQTRYRFEKKVAEQLRTKGVETFLPLREEIHRWSDRCKDVSLPLFPGYAFVRTDGKPDSRTRVLQTAGLISFVSRHGQAVSVPQKQIELLELLLARVGGHPLTNWRTQPRSLHRIHSTLCSYQDRRLRD